MWQTYPARRRHIRHGETRNGKMSPEYATWNSIMQRCYNPRVINYARYGGRGIRVCRRWHSVSRFIADIGRRPSARHSIERRRNSGNYTPKNCFWATRFQQAQNTRRTRRLTILGVTLALAQWSRLARKERKTITTRLALKWSPIAAVFAPIGYGYNRKRRTRKADKELLRKAVAGMMKKRD